MVEEKNFMSEDIREKLVSCFQTRGARFVIDIYQREKLTVEDLLKGITVQPVYEYTPYLYVKEGKYSHIMIVLPQPSNIEKALEEIEEFMRGVFLTEKQDWSPMGRAESIMGDAIQVFENIYGIRGAHGSIEFDGTKAEAHLSWREAESREYCPILSIGEGTMQICEKSDCKWFDRENNECVVVLLGRWYYGKKE
jgi:hypothetical protein